MPIEEIVEFRFDMDIVPEPGLHAHFDIDSYITHDLREIRVDEFVYEVQDLVDIDSALHTHWGIDSSIRRVFG